MIERKAYNGPDTDLVNARFETFTPNAENRLGGYLRTRTGDPNTYEATFQYDHRGTRTVQIGHQNAATRRFVVDSLNPTGYAQVLQERDSENAAVRSYVLGDDVLGQIEDAMAGQHRLMAYDGVPWVGQVCIP